ncbi:endoplasmic oxidoreductin-1 [Colletotrichum higginsianum]|uniref:Endoplasmic oxidoreductin-1 n=1 Tax=Colletotrichum higginsianum (strain IMI 349063) TaxID=759273 RepID=H1VIW9_COLHI|nr:Endoplasmic oxidoreductin-1 [Colletotrichum higginsianum IMI 349063]OBR10138.1 Endoplasmic oxidoreductin-1 [Colletotrichum higginsianum IMI 349063]CCF40172.1 endoplasmic oxidoreductin-1 [Colletotrichum higginsianum]
MIVRYAAVFFPLLFSLSGAHAEVSDSHISLSNSTYQISPKAIVSDACASYSTLDRLNTKVKPLVDDLTRSTDFFSHYRLNLFHKKCPFWNDENGMCGNIACAVETLDNEEDIPEVWRASELGKLEGPLAKHPPRRVQHERPERPLQGKLGEEVGESCVVEYDDECDERDYCVPEDESASSKGDYVSLLRNPERFTGYGGFGAAQVWDAIYRENCFQKSSFPHSASLGQSQVGHKGPAAQDFRQVLEAVGRQQALEQMRETQPNAPFVAQTGLEVEDECLEKRVFYRVISGMHASISTHLCWDFLNQTTGQWQPNVACYRTRLHTHPERISNLYFNYALVTRAVAKLGPYLQGRDYTFCSGDIDQDASTRAKVLEVTEGAASVPQIFDESLMFKNGEGPSLKEDFRNRFRNISRVMDCVGCDKCRLWGKLQTAGYGTALKVLFEFDNASEDIPVLKRTELVALFNTYARISSSLDAITKFRAMIDTEDALTAASATAPKLPKSASEDIPDRAKKPHHVVTSPETGSMEKKDPEDEYAEDEPRREETLSDALGEEFDRVIKAFNFVLRRWLSFPKTFFNVAVVELIRFYQFFVGLPVSERNWSFERPVVDEL